MEIFSPILGFDDETRFMESMFFGKSNVIPIKLDHPELFSKGYYNNHLTHLKDIRINELIPTKFKNVIQQDQLTVANGTLTHQFSTYEIEDLVNYQSFMYVSDEPQKETQEGAKKSFTNRKKSFSRVAKYRKKCVSCCIKLASYNFIYKKPMYCGDCRHPNMFDVRSRKCIVCHVKQPSYNITGSRVAKVCSTCSTPGMINVRRHKPGDTLD